MVFSSALFLFYFLPVFLAGYFVTPKGWRNLYTATISLGFYAWGAPHFLALFLGSCLCDYFLTNQIDTSNAPLRRRWLLLASTSLNLGLLLYFKYANFFVEQLQAVAITLGVHLPKWHKVILPIGISFFTFHKISYVVDIYRGTSQRARSFGEYLLYITFFPQLIAGPIVRYHEIEEQIRARTVTFALFTEGVWRFVLGLSAKVLIADPLGSVADHLFKGDPLAYSTGYTWLGTVAYTLQIYFDFSGYSSMAIGLALMVGFHFPENFHRPYLAGSVTDFWRRWHISLSRWMRDYLYIPLGGNRVSPTRQMVNLWTVFLLSGLWHGAAWTFIVWGAYHGFFLAIEKTSVGKKYLLVPALVRRGATLVAVMFGWVLFRSDTLSDAIARWGLLVGVLSPNPEAPPVMRAGVISDFGAIILVIGLAWCLFIEPLLERRDAREDGRPLFIRYPLVYPALLALLILSILAIESGSYSPFIYFQF